MGVVIISFPLLLVPAPGAVPQHDSPLRAAGMTRRPELGRRNQRKSVAIGAKSIARWCIVSLHLAMSQRLDPTSINLHTRALSQPWGCFRFAAELITFGCPELSSFLPSSLSSPYIHTIPKVNELGNPWQRLCDHTCYYYLFHPSSSFRPIGFFIPSSIFTHPFTR